MLTEQTLLAIMPTAGSRARVYAPLLNATMSRFLIDSPRRVAAFVAQLGHESGSLRYTREIASGKAYDTGAKAIALGNTPAADGDGQRYRGGGLFQVTGLDNYRACGRALGIDLVGHPELIEEPTHACDSAGWYWSSRGLNKYADTDRFADLTRRINGGFTHLDERISIWLRARHILGVRPL